MDKFELVRNKLESKIFTPYGITAVYKTRTPVLNSFGEIESYTDVTSTTRVVPYNITSNRFIYNGFSNIEEGEFEAAVPYDAVLNTQDVITFSNTDYIIKEILPNYLLENVVNIIRLVKDQN